MKRTVYYALPFFGYFLMLAVAGHIPLSVHLNSWGFTDKVLHFLAYILLALLLFRFLRGYGYRGRYLPVLILGFVYAAVDEATQALVPGRFVSFYDFLANTAGFGLGYFLFSRWLVHCPSSEAPGD
ncbi:MAG: VanZ family protein [Acidobacteria bacterium]|nr:VanZ family protein [Acidobacteriota bacterium]